MLSVEIGMLENGDLSKVVEIYFDKTGLEYLLARIAHITAGKTDHVDLMSESWGLGDLDEDKHRASSHIAHHLKLVLMEQKRGSDMQI
jgi:hypothetical protein